MTARFMMYGGNPLSCSPVDAAVAALGALAADAGDGDHTVVGTETNTRDMFYKNLIVATGTILIVRAWRIFFRYLWVQTGGILHCDGLDASGATGGLAFTTGSLGPNIAGVNGGTGVGANGINALACILPRSGVLDGTLFRGGNGGASSTPNAGGTAGTIGVFSSGRQARQNVLTGAAMSSSAIGQMTPGSSGGAGGGDGTNAGGGSGSSGGFGFGMGGEVLNEGIIRAAGGRGGNGVAGGAGGGGGGSGGAWEFTVGRYLGNVPICPGGAGGNPAGGGVAGLVGKDGDYFINQFKAA